MLGLHVIHKKHGKLNSKENVFPSNSIKIVFNRRLGILKIYLLGQGGTKSTRLGILILQITGSLRVRHTFSSGNHLLILLADFDMLILRT